MFFSSHFHNYVHSLGFSLGPGARTALSSFIVDKYANNIAPGISLSGTASVIRIMPSWNTALTGTERARLEQHLSSVICHFLFHACTLAEMHGRKQVTASDIILITTFVDKLMALKTPY